MRQPLPDALTFIERKLGILSSNRLPFNDWLKQVRDEEAITPLSEFLEEYFLHMSGGGVVLDTCNSRVVSPSLRSSGAVDKETMDLYVDYWRSINYLT